MKKIRLIIFLFIIFFLVGGVSIASAQHQVIDVYFFKSETCPYCKKLAETIEQAKSIYPNLQVNELDVINEEDSRVLLDKMLQAYNTSYMGVPIVFIGETVVQGYDPDKLLDELRTCYQAGCISPMDKVADLPPEEEPKEEPGANQKESGYLGWIIAIVVAVIIVAVAFIALKKKKSPADL